MPAVRTLRFASSVHLRSFLPRVVLGSEGYGQHRGTVKIPPGRWWRARRSPSPTWSAGKSQHHDQRRREFVASPLRVGRYTVTVEKAGFKKAVTEALDLTCNSAPPSV